MPKITDKHSGYASMALNISVSLFLLIMIIYPSYSQMDFEDVLKTIESNNRALKANEQLWQSRQYEYRTGLYLRNPSVSLDYLFGNRPEIGNRYEINVIQQFDFPTAYSHRNRISDLRINQINPQKRIFRQEILLEAYITLIDLVYYNRLEDILELRHNTSDSIIIRLEKAVDKGEKSILELNRAKLEGIRITSRVNDIRSRKSVTKQKLNELNGGIELNITLDEYPQIPVDESYETYITRVMDNHPLIQAIEAETEISRARISLNKSLSLPGFEIGYRHDNETGFNYNGMHFGISIPLFENKYTVAAAESELLYNQLNLERTRFKIRNDLEQLHTRYLSLSEQSEQIRQVSGSINQAELVGRAYNYGQITYFEYSYEINNIYETLIMLIESEKELAETKARLMLEGFLF